MLHVILLYHILLDCIISYMCIFYFRRAHHSTKPSILPYYGPIRPLPHNVSMAWLWPARGSSTHTRNKPSDRQNEGSESHPTDNEQKEQKQSEHELSIFSSRPAWDLHRSRLFSGVPTRLHLIQLVKHHKGNMSRLRGCPRFLALSPRYR